MSNQEHLKWKGFWDEQASVEDPHQAVRGDRIMTAEVQDFHDRRLIDLLSPDSGDTLLDAGCGVGDQVLLFGSRVSAITAIDFSPAMVERCRVRVASASGITADVKIEVADVTDLPYPDNTFDKAVSIAVLQYLNPEECDRMFSELSRVVKPSGVIVFHIKDLYSPTGLMITFGRFLRAIIKGRPPLEYHYRTDRWYKKKARAFGTIENSYAYGTWTPFMPVAMMAAIARWETKYRLIQDNFPHGKEYFIRLRNDRRNP
jgi:ubiquinone/menaquinone biosynthesis C-methylase UbiE